MKERKKKKLIITWRSNYYCCCYSYDYDEKGLVVFLFGPKIETIDTPLTNCLKVIIVWARYKQKGTITIEITTAIAIPIAIIDSAVMLCYAIFILFCLCRTSNVICNVICLPMHYKYTLHSKSHSLCIYLSVCLSVSQLQFQTLTFSENRSHIIIE